MRRAELQGRRAQIHAMPGRHGGKPVAQRHLVGRGLLVLEVPAAGDQARIIGAAHHHMHAALLAAGEELVQCGLVQQAVAPGQQEDIRVRLLQRQNAGFDAVDAEAPATDHAFLPQPRQGHRGALHGDVEDLAPMFAMRVLGTVVDIGDVDAGQAQALQAVLDGAAHAIRGVVVIDPERQAGDEGAMLPALRGIGTEQPADLGGEHELIARLVAQHLAEAVLRNAGPVFRRGVEVADAGIPGRFQRRHGIGVRDDLEHVAQRRAAEADRPRRRIVLAVDHEVSPQ